MQEHVRAARGGVVGNEEQVVACWSDRDITACAGGVPELGAERGARPVTCENAQHFAVGRGVRIYREGAEAREKARDIEPHHFSAAGVDFGVIVDVAVVASVPEAHANALLISAAVITD